MNTFTGRQAVVTELDLLREENATLKQMLAQAYEALDVMKAGRDKADEACREFRKLADSRLESLNQALATISKVRIRLHQLKEGDA